MVRGRDAAPSRLIALLDDERDALLAADFDRLDRLAPAKAALLAHLANVQPGAAALARLGRAVARNQRLLAAAIAGVRRGRSQLDAVSRRATAFTTYDSAGSASQVGAVLPAIERKA